MFRELKRNLFPAKYLLRENVRRLDRIEKEIAEHQAVFNCLLPAIHPPDSKELAYYFLLHRTEGQSQFFQDLWVLRELKGKTGGYFVEFGAGDGVKFSNTFLLEKKYGWTGILSEPLPRFQEKLKKRTAILDPRCVWSVSGQKLKFLCADKPEFSGVQDTAFEDNHADSRKSAQEIEVETISLNDLLAQHQAPRVIDYLSVDTEGSEYEILANFDFTKHHFNTINVEHNSTYKREKIFDLLTRNGYLRVFEEFSRADDWYVHGSLRGK